jgi:tetratricopeptide (TPR) repeat protein
MKPCLCFLTVLVLVPAVIVFPQPDPGAGVSAAAAEQYLLWAEQAVGEGRRDDALAALERGADFADVSSDISYLLAELRYRGNFPLSSALDSLRRAFDAGRWEHYTPSRGRLLEAELLICLRNYSGALRSLTMAEQDPSFGFETDALPGIDVSGEGASQTGGQRAAVLRLLALKGLGDTEEFIRYLGLVMDRYPRDPRPPEILFTWARDRMPGGADRPLVDLALRRLLRGAEIAGTATPGPGSPGPRLRGIAASSRFMYLAAPFIRDNEDARRLVSAYRAAGGAEPESLPIALDLGLIDDWQAVAELFGPPSGVLDKDTLLRVWSLLRSREGRDLFRRNLLVFSGTIVTDDDRDGLWEEWVRYSAGTAQEYHRDADQDGLAELRAGFSAGGVPVLAEDARGLRIEWERYPAVLRAELDGVVYIPGPETLFYAPLRLSRLLDEEPGFLCPEADVSHTALSERTLVSFSLNVIRPSVEFPGGSEYIELSQGIPRRATEQVEGRIVAVTEFVRGEPRIQRLDADLDGWMETIRYFRTGSILGENPLAYEKIPELIETDRDRDGLYEMEERFFPDGTSVYSWDTDGDGVRDYVETRGGDSTH